MQTLTDDLILALRRDTPTFYANGGDLPQFLADLVAAIAAVPIAGSVLEASIASLAVSAAKLKADLQDLFVVATWGTPDAEAGNKIEVLLQLTDIAGNDLAASLPLEIHVADTAGGADSATATLSAGATPIGTILAGDDSAEMKILTDAAGQFALEISETAAASRFITCRPCYGSPILDCRSELEAEFV